MNIHEMCAFMQTTIIHNDVWQFINGTMQKIWCKY